MTFLWKAAIMAVLAVVFLSPSRAVFAAETYDVAPIGALATYRFDNENWFTLPHPKVASFTVEDDGNFSGMTEDGIPFTQRNVPNTLGIRIQRFEIQDHYHFIVEGEEAYSADELAVKVERILTERGQ